MTESPIDPERLAAFLDGRVPEPERSAVVKQIASLDEAYDVLVDASAVLSEVEASSTIGSSPRPTRRRHTARSRPLKVIVVAAAASLVFAAAAKSWLNRSTPSGGDRQMIALVASTSGTLEPGFYSASLWSATRGIAAPIRPDARAVRLGVRVADLSLNGAARTSTGSTPIVDVADLLGGISGAGVSAAMIRAMADSGTLSDAQTRRVHAEAMQYADSSLVAAGFTLELSRAAAASRNDAFFADVRTTRTLSRVAELPVLRQRAPNDAAALEALARSSAASRDWAQIQETISEVIRVLAS